MPALLAAFPSRSAGTRNLGYEPEKAEAVASDIAGYPVIKSPAEASRQSKQSRPSASAALDGGGSGALSFADGDALAAILKAARENLAALDAAAEELADSNNDGADFAAAVSDAIFNTDDEETAVANISAAAANFDEKEIRPLAAALLAAAISGKGEGEAN